MKRIAKSEVVIHCAVCLNRGQRVAADTLVKGYAVCEDHIELVSRPGFDISTLLVGQKKSV